MNKQNRLPDSRQAAYRHRIEHCKLKPTPMQGSIYAGLKSFAFFRTCLRHKYLLRFIADTEEVCTDGYCGQNGLADCRECIGE